MAGTDFDCRSGIPEREKLQKIFQKAGVRTFCCSTLLEAESFLSGQSVSAVFAETLLPDGDFEQFDPLSDACNPASRSLRSRWNMDWNSYLAAMGAGAFDC